MNGLNTEPEREKPCGNRRIFDHDWITEKIIGASFRVGNELGPGFLEKVYENALCLEVNRHGLHVAQQARVQVKYRDQQVGVDYCDLLVENAVIVEVKAVKTFDDFHIAQCLNYLKATGLRACLLINFNKPRIEIKRIVTDATDGGQATNKPNRHE